MILEKKYQDRFDEYEAFAKEFVAPIAAELDAEARFPVETVPKLAERGMLGIVFPKEYGGLGMDALSYALAVEAVSKYCASTGIIISAQNSLAGYPIHNFGTEEQKQKYLVPLAKGEILGGFGLTERGAGSDAAKQETTAVIEGDHYVLNGKKRFITNSGYAGVYVVMAMTDKSLGNHGISAFIVEKDFPGFSIGKKEIKMGIRGSATAELIMDNCIVPKENLLGEIGQGFKIAMKTLDCGRIGVAAQALGFAEGAIDVTVEYVKQREQFDKRISQFQNTQFELAEMKTETEAAKLLVYKAARMKDEGLTYSAESAMAKMYASQVASDVTRRALQLFGGCGYTNEHPIERMMRDAKITEIYEGTNEIQRIVIAANMGLK